MDARIRNTADELDRYGRYGTCWLTDCYPGGYRSALVRVGRCISASFPYRSTREWGTILVKAHPQEFRASPCFA